MLPLKFELGDNMPTSMCACSLMMIKLGCADPCYNTHVDVKELLKAHTAYKFSCAIMLYVS